jgi:hypothetical protein
MIYSRPPHTGKGGRPLAEAHDKLGVHDFESIQERTRITFSVRSRVPLAALEESMTTAHRELIGNVRRCGL